MAKDIETVLRNFIRHVTNLKAEDDPAGTGIHREFRMLREAQIQNRNEDRFPTEDGKKDENTKKNRYRDILPRDDRRVKLTPVPGEKGSDYINATFLEDVHEEYGYIAAQGPMPNTVNDFWRMLWEYNTEIVFMVCRTKEDGKQKCEKYWADLDQNATFGGITTYTDDEEEVQDHFIRRQLRAVKNGETHHLTQFHYTGWPDHNIPSSPDALRKMIEEVRNYRKKPKIPMVVHCSAGCGRTGTICAIDYAWTLLDEGLIEQEFSMFDIIMSMREQRMSMVQTPDQYEYTHMVVKSLCDEWLTSFADHDYVNVTLKTAAKAEPPEENYCNVNFQAGDASSSEPVVVSTSGKEANKPLRNMSAAATSNKQDIKHQKPEIKHQKPEIKHQKPDAKKPVPEVVKIKKQAGPTTPIAASRAKNFHVENSKSNEVDAGEYVEVRQTASASASPTSNVPPTLPSKKNPPPDTAGLDPLKSDPHKTTITLTGGSAPPQIIMSSSGGVSQGKERAPKPPAVQVMKGTSGPVTSAPGHQMFQQDSSDMLYMQVSKPASPASRPDQIAAKITSDQSSNTTKQEVPELPQRNYKPEEVHPTAATTISNSSIISDANKPNYDNVIVIPTPQQQQQQQHARPSTAPTPRLDPTRAPQPIPKAQPHSHTPFARSGQPQPQPQNRQAAAHQTAQAHTVHSGQHSRPFGMVSAMGGGGGHQVAPVRQGAGASHSGTQQAFFPSSGDPRQGPVVMKAQSAGVMRNHSPPASAPQPGQILVAKKGKIVYLTERPHRVHGPRPLPPGWTTFSKNHRGTFL